ncbi:low molecular weight phosphatase family protein [Gorillibacterium massiliense]|uniref:arsenate reductase/protein-tyrosine-phosphatase family protein n=1 Tax=Gorillibacterium massiliense TaxID=1280390 RepID=UPI0004B1CD6A|nr:low molecular weight phosphatase family protein [Gorillibacterium massiliense]
MVRTVLFVCTGNTCRSPLAEGLFREMVKREGLAIVIKSAGVSAMNGASISTHSQTVLREKGAKTNGGCSQILDRKLADEADLILTMTVSHKRQVLSRFPDAAGRVYTL